MAAEQTGADQSWGHTTLLLPAFFPDGITDLWRRALSECLVQ